MTQRLHDHHQHQPADSVDEPTLMPSASKTSSSRNVSEGGQARVVGGGGHRARQQFSNNLFQRQREQYQPRGSRGSRCLRQSSEPTLSTSTSSSHHGHPTAVAARLAMLSVGDQIDSGGDSGKSANPSKGHNYCVRQSSEPILSNTAMAMPPGVSRGINSTSSAVAPSSKRLSDSTDSNCTENSSSTANSRRSSASSSFGSLWEERRDCRQKQVGPNPFAFF